MKMISILHRSAPALVRQQIRRSNFSAAQKSCSIRSIAPSPRQFSNKAWTGGNELNEFSEKSPTATTTEDWIRPQRPLIGDVGQSHLYAKEDDDDADETLKSETSTSSYNPDDTTGVDWLRTRRSKLEDNGELLTPDEGTAKKRALGTIPVLEHVLLSRSEITSCLDALGAREIVVVMDNPKRPRMGHSTEGMIFCTAVSFQAAQLYADTLVREMRKRKLQDTGVVGAQLGPEGIDENDPFDDSTWVIVDCDNHVVHIMDDITRNHLKLEDLWSGKEKALLKLNSMDEEAVDEYVAANPVPEGYGRRRSNSDWNETMRRLEKTRFTTEHKRPVVPKKRKQLRKR